MTDDTTPSGTSAAGTSGGVGGAARKLLLVVGLLAFLAVAALLGWLIAATVGLRFWASFLGNRIDGSMINGALWGLALGFVFTLIPLIVARQALRGFSIVVRIVILALAAVIALPNVATLAIQFGTGSGAHAGQRIFDVDAPFVVGGTWVGLAIAVAVFVLLTFWGVLRWNDKRKTRKLSRRLAEMAGDAAEDGKS